MNRFPHHLVFGVAAVLALAGCGKSSPWETTYKASGKVIFKGQPISGAQLIFYPKDPSAPKTIRPTATTDDAGTFTISTHHKEDGAPAGDYRVAVVWHPLVNSPAGPSRGPNKLPARYAQPDTSNLEVHVDPSNNTLSPLEVKP